MSKSILLSGVIYLSLAALPASVLAHGGGGGGGAPQAPRMAAPQAPRMQAPQMPRMQAQQMPRMQAPQMPRMQAQQMPRMQAPRMQQMPRMQAPQMSRMEAPRAPRMEAQQMGRMQAPRSTARMEETRPSRMAAESSRAEASRSATSRNGNLRSEANASRSIERSANSLRANNKSLERSSNSMKDMTGRAAEAKRNIAPESKLARMAPQQRAEQYNRMAPAQRNQAMGRLDGQQRAETMAKMKPAERAEAMYKMNPSQRAETLARMSPQMRDSFEGRKEGTNSGAQRAAGMSGGRKIALGGAALLGGSMVARQAMQRPGENVPARGRTESAERSGAGERAGGVGRGGAGERGGVPRAPGYANPRKVDGTRLGGKSPLSQRLGAPLAWRSGAERPRAGNAKTGVGGPLDPGGYTRRGAQAPSHFTPSFATNQLAQHFPNYAAQVAFNHQNLISNRANWPWQLPNYSPSWFNNGQGNWNWNQNWWQQPWQNWRNEQLALNNAAAQSAWWNNIAYNNGNNWWNWNNGFGGGAGFWPWGINSGMNWLGDLNYYNSYGYDGANYPTSYFADNGYSPTPYIFDVGAGQFWQPGNGYADSLPENYRAPITVAIQESVPTYDGQGEITGYQLQNFYYNAFWIPQDESYGYYDYKQQFHYVTFPWLNSWQGQQ